MVYFLRQLSGEYTKVKYYPGILGTDGLNKAPKVHKVHKVHRVHKAPKVHKVHRVHKVYKVHKIIGTWLRNTYNFRHFSSL